MGSPVNAEPLAAGIANISGMNGNSSRLPFLSRRGQDFFLAADLHPIANRQAALFALIVRGKHPMISTQS